jgi:hypothetical protein
MQATNSAGPCQKAGNPRQKFGEFRDEQLERLECGRWRADPCILRNIRGQSESVLFSQLRGFEVRRLFASSDPGLSNRNGKQFLRQSSNPVRHNTIRIRILSRFGMERTPNPWPASQAKSGVVSESPTRRRLIAIDPENIKAGLGVEPCIGRWQEIAGQKIE